MSWGNFNAGVKSGLKSGKLGELGDVTTINSYDLGLLRYDADTEKWTADPGNVEIQGDLFMTGTTRILGDLYVTGTSYLQRTVIKHRTDLDVSGSTIFGDDDMDTHQFSGSVWISTSLSASSYMVSTTLTASSINVEGPTVLNNVSYTWPTSSGATNQVLTTDGAGTVTWRTVGSGDDDFTSNGDEWPANRTIGNITDFYLGVITNDTQRIHVTAEGYGGFVGFGVEGSDVTHRLTLPNSSTGNSGSCKAHKYATYSSKRYKKNVHSIEDPLRKAMQMRGVFFEWKDSDKEDMGFIAEEVGEILPRIVDYEPNGVDAESMEYAKMGALLLECVKEQQKMIKGLDLALLRDAALHKKREIILQAQIVLLMAGLGYLLWF